MRNYVIGLLCLCLALVIAPGPAAAQERSSFTSDFETCHLLEEGQLWDGAEVAKPERLRIVKHTVRSGNCALRLALHPRDGAGGSPKRNRAELKVEFTPVEGGDTYWAYSIYVPDHYPDTPDDGSIIMGQWKPTGLVDGVLRKVGPTVAIHYGQRGNLSGFHVNAGVKGENVGTVAKFPALRGRWHDFVLHIRWSTGDAGVVEVWHNGQHKGAKHGANMEVSEPYHFKIGQYAGTRHVRRPATVYFDEVRVAPTFDEVVLTD